MNEYSEELGIDEVKKVAQWVMSDKEDSTPSYLQEYLEEDDEYKLADLVLNILELKISVLTICRWLLVMSQLQSGATALESGEFDISDYLEEYWR